jgi:hypothetical protein
MKTGLTKRQKIPEMFSDERREAASTQARKNGISGRGAK